MTLTPEEEDRFTNEIDHIIGYLNELRGVEGTDAEHHRGDVQNVMRDDTDAHEAGVYTKDILDNAPERDGDYIKVPKILSNE